MPYAILRIAKINTVAGVRSATQHITRQRVTPNADPAGKVTRLDMGYRDPADEVLRRLPAKRRKDAVLAIEHMMTMSPEWAKDKGQAAIERWAQDSVQWLRDRYKDEHIAFAVLHQDETTPHIHALVVPIKDGNLSAYEYTGGRQKLSEMQNSYAQQMEPHGLERGIKGSRAHHTAVKAFYGALESGRYQRPKKEGILDLGYDKRLREYNETVLAHARTGALALKRADEMELTAKRLGGALDKAQDNLVKAEMELRASKGATLALKKIFGDRAKRVEFLAQFPSYAKPEDAQFLGQGVVQRLKGKAFNEHDRGIEK